MGKIKGFILNRKQYDRIRKMDHCQMTLWAESVYKSGYADGKESAKILLMARIKTDIMVWSKAFLSKCKLQKWNFVMKPTHRGCDVDTVKFRLICAHCVDSIKRSAYNKQKTVYYANYPYVNKR